MNYLTVLNELYRITGQMYRRNNYAEKEYATVYKGR